MLPIFLVNYAIVIIFLKQKRFFFLKLVHAVLSAEQPIATFIPKNTGRTEFLIHTNKGCGFQNNIYINAYEDPQGPNEPNQPSSNNTDNCNNNNNHNNGAGDNVQIPTIICNC